MVAGIMTEENAEEEEMLKWAKGYAQKQGWTLRYRRKATKCRDPGAGAEQKEIRKTVLPLPYQERG